jgi:hypothetical protein
MGDDVHSPIASSAKKAGEKNLVGNDCDRPASPFESQVGRLLAIGWRLETASGKDLPSPESPTCPEYAS